MELLEFIINDKPLKSKKYVMKKYKPKYKTQNNGLLDWDVEKFIKLYNKDVELCFLCNGIILQNHSTCLMGLNFHTVLLYKNKKGQIERYDTMNEELKSNDKTRIQYTSNNCSLYAGIVGIIRPLVKDMKTMMKILKLVSDKPNTKSCDKLSAISKHYFGRDKSYFNY